MISRPVDESTNVGAQGTYTRIGRETLKHASAGVITLKDVRILGYAEYGNPMATPINLLHGCPESRLCGAIFDRVAREHKAHLLVADRPGYATSSPGIFVSTTR